MPRSPVLLRDARLEDCERSVAVLARNGLVVPTDPEAARRSWEWLWGRNPAMAGRQLPMGWVLESDSDIVGFFGNIPRRYHYEGRDVLAGVGSSWAVDPGFRSGARPMLATWFAQREADLLLATTAMQSVGRALLKFSAVPMPQASYQQVLYWVLDAAGFLQSALRKKEVRAPLTRAAGFALSPLATAVVTARGRPGRLRAGLEPDVVRAPLTSAAGLALSPLATPVLTARGRPGRLRAGLEPEVVDLSEVGEQFDDLWRRKNAEERRLYASRTAEDLRWHFEPGAQAGTVEVLCCRRHGRLDGYVVVLRTETHDIGLVRAKIADLLVADDDARVVDALLAGAYQWGRSNGCHVLELTGLPPAIRTVAERSRPLIRALPTHPFLYKALTPELQVALEAEEAWYPSLYDGDTTLV